MRKMLTKINEAEVCSSEGFRVKYGRHTLTYIESGRYVPVPIEHLGDPYEMEVYFSRVVSWYVEGCPQKPMTINQKAVLKRRIVECLQFLGRRFSMQ